MTLKIILKADPKTRFRTRYDALETIREAHYERDKVMSREPYIELIPQYKTLKRNDNTLKITDLSKEEFGDYFDNNGQFDFFYESCIQGVFFRIHYTNTSYDMLMNATRGNGNDIAKDSIITSGTGVANGILFFCLSSHPFVRRQNNGRLPIIIIQYGGKQY